MKFKKEIMKKIKEIGIGNSFIDTTVRIELLEAILDIRDELLAIGRLIDKIDMKL